MSLTVHTIENLRYNPFTQVFTEYGYGYDGNTKEVHSVPVTAPYWVFLNEIPKYSIPSTLFINEQGGGNFTEVSFTTSPASGQFRVCYGGDGTTTIATAGQGIVEFHSSDAGKTVEVKYYGLGTINQKSLFTSINQKGMELTDYTDSATIKLAYGRSEEVDGKLVIVDEVDYTITDSGIANGIVYVHLLVDGNGVATAYLSINAGTFNSQKGGTFHTDGAKVLFMMVKTAGPVYSNKTSLKGFPYQEKRDNFQRYTAGDYYFYNFPMHFLFGTGTHGSYTKTWEVQIFAVGTIRVKFQLTPTAGTNYGRIYVNGIAIGTERSGSGTWTEDITITNGDLLQIYCKSAGASGSYLDFVKLGINNFKTGIVDTTFDNYSNT